MAKYFNMIIVLGLITLVSGLALGGLNDLTFEKAQNNILKFKKLPAVASIYALSVEGGLIGVALEEQLLTDKLSIDLDLEEPVLVFVIKKDSKPIVAAIENFGAGFGGDVGMMVGFDLNTGNLVGVGVTTMAETPGIGTRINDTAFTAQFQGLGRDTVLKVKKDGGAIDALSGATVSSRAATTAVFNANEFYKLHEKKIKEAVNQ